MSIKKIKSSIVSNIENDTINSGIPAETLHTNNIATILEALDNRAITITPEYIEILGRSGVTVKNACSLLHKSFQYFDENPTMLEAFNRGRAQLGSRVRSKLIEAALENNNIQSAIHLDKIYSGDAPASEVNVNVTASQLSTVSDEDLMRVAFTVDSVEDIDGGDRGDTHCDTLGEKDSKAD